MTRMATPTSGRAGTRDRRAALVLAALAGWGIAVPWLARGLGLELDVPARLEVIDHVLPGAAVMVCAAIVRMGIAGAGELRWLGAASVACLAGLWITSTHATLVPEALDGVAPWGAALLHLSAGPPIVLAALWVLLAAPSRR